MADRPLLCLFARVRNEVVREGNITRMLANAERLGVDAAVICDDGSTDGTAEVVEAFVRKHETWSIERYASERGKGTVESFGPNDDARWAALLVPPDHPERAFEKELRWKERMMQRVHQIRPHWVLWLDADEVFDRAGTEGLRKFLENHLDDPRYDAWAAHYSQLWRASTWARTDDGFDAGVFIKVWKYTPELSFEIREDGLYKGLHHPQFPIQVMRAFEQGRVGRLPFEQIHYGNLGKSLVWKCLQYANGLGGVARHLRFERGQYRPVDPCTLPDGAEHAPVLPVAHHESIAEVSEGKLNLSLFYPSRPQPYTSVEIERILALGNLRGVEDMFTVVIPSFNRAHTLDRTLQSLLDQTYTRWVAVVLDDGSTDDTAALMRYWQDRDPRIFYARYPENRGGVAMNELGMALACEWTSWWTRLGSDDWFGPHKLEYDAKALRDHDACFGAYQVLRDGALMEICNGPVPATQVREALLGKRFMASWCNCAVRTSALRAVRERWGHFCDPRLKNMEDFLVNARIARCSRGWVWRGVVGSIFTVNPGDDECRAILKRFTERKAVDELEATWTCVTTGASGNTLQTAKDDNLTRALITQDTLVEQGLVR